MPNILELFNQNEILDYQQSRELPPMLGETLFPEKKVNSLKLDQISGGSRLPVAASIHAFDTEAEIGSREATKSDLSLTLIKRKMPLKEEDIIALENPRTPQEQKYLMENVFNDMTTLVNGVRARVEQMRMDVLANGVLKMNENGVNLNIDYHVPVEHKEALSGVNLWSDANANPLADIDRWTEKMDTTPTRVLTSKAILNQLLRHPKVLIGIFGKDSGKLLTRAELDAFMIANQMPLIRTYDEKYRKQKDDGTYEALRYFPNNKFVMFSDNLLGETLYGPTAEEIRLARNPAVDLKKVGNILTTMYEENTDPVATYTKAVATAVPSFPAADEVFQAQPIL
ncbi:minor capsid protein E [Listeria sp. SHR_NRA_18]|uniref:major capsid protein n=1 Tax=Listeria sp. SHR_NRA_18 TaxID=2269046 RepID=UPI00051CC32F|nr:major capsid protein [Listeria sp. SHR_NRA_18]KGL46044.1 head protein [Listeriaceae bacterium FSL A5-0209]RQW66706.1 minor capsid protein E [Listeria sp. SHR_NRA_18]